MVSSRRQPRFKVLVGLGPLRVCGAFPAHLSDGQVGLKAEILEGPSLLPVWERVRVCHRMRVSAGVVTLSFTNIEQEMCDRTPMHTTIVIRPPTPRWR